MEMTVYSSILFLGFAWGVFEKGFSPWFFALMLFMDLMHYAYKKAK